ncbi:hypothetical protein [Geomicrobium sp. JCM 19055]|uniref:hypothetical protein n=1 Tax=Geomicrobium sp. JCM 19055 TaxID=1460649 RepID=UPI0012685AE3|nr:hypothetical protein [Geomicrobium sp. JCM 19055]
MENARITDYSSSNGTVTITNSVVQSNSFNVPEGADFEALLGTSGTFVINSNNDIVDSFTANEQVVFGAVTDVKFDGSTPVEIELNGEWYDLNNNYVPRFNGDTGESLVQGDRTVAEERTADYAKFVVNSAGEVVFYDAYDWDDSILVESVEDGIVYGYGQEEDASDYTIVQDGQTISVDDLNRGDILYYNVDAEYAEVYNNLVSGEVESVFEESVVVDGVEYEYNGARYLAADGTIQNLDATLLEEFIDTDEPITLYLNREGHISYVIADFEGISVTGNGVFLNSEINAFAQGTRAL